MRHLAAALTRKLHAPRAAFRRAHGVEALENRTLLSAMFPLSINWQAGDQPRSVAVGDFNGDGRQDLAVANSASANVSVLLGNGAGGVTAAPSVAVGVQPYSVAVGDFNGDGRQDLAVANSYSGNVSVLLGNGAGGFTAAPSVAVGDQPESVAVGDFNGDGRQDLAVANSASANVSVLLGNGAGGFTAAPSVAVGDQPESVAVGDFNGDGRQDLAVANAYSGNVSVLLGSGAGGFGAAPSVAVGRYPYFVAIADFNRDGRQDLAVANLQGGDVSVLLGNGAGQFTAAPSPVAGTFPSSVAVADFNGDARLDLVVGQSGPSENVSVLLGDGSGTFTAATFVAAGVTPFSVTVGDFNGDGRPDLAAANFNTANVTVALNAHPAAVVTLSAPDPSAAEAGQDSGTFRLARDGYTDGDLIVSLDLGGTAVIGTDSNAFLPEFFPGYYIATIPAGTSFVDLTVIPIDDALAEGPETYELSIGRIRFGRDYFIDAVNNTGTVTIADNDRAAATVAGRRAFYNRSAFDGNDAGANAADDAAIAAGKSALLPGQATSFANVTSYARGIDGVMVDISGLPLGVVLTPADFSIRSRRQNASTFSAGPSAAQVGVRRGAGVNGSDRVTLVWPDYNPAAGPPLAQAVANGWLEVTVRANGNTGLAAPDVFWFGNLIGDTGDSATNLRVSALDLGAVKRALNTNVTLASTVDFNRDGRINALDLGIVKQNLNHSLPLLPAQPFAVPVQIALAPGLFSDGSMSATRRLADEVLA